MQGISDYTRLMENDTLLTFIDGDVMLATESDRGVTCRQQEN